ncbi:hypothetical protein [Paenibacillus wynnii]|uniref:Uncharacterized protein n=1 Tax=Paenibacillus wynnii TaxID=268407 RepID=A0A098MDM4_9BACL|nr:hypothetical protein [Paenibacillus wynnii]KGE20669.1 hypothetical protein PWYN_00250 [Paenibacillus wynnii]
MKPKSYTVIQSDPGNKLFEGQTVTPYFEDEKEIIITVPGAYYDHHILKDGSYFAAHLKPTGGK